MKTQKLFKFFLGIAFALLLVLSVSQNADASFNNEDLCEASGGSWTPTDEYNIANSGICTYPPDHENSSECPEGYSYLAMFQFDGSVDLASGCYLIDSGSPGNGGTDTRHSGTSSDVEVTTCTLAAGDWRCAYFAEGTCAQNCYIDPHLPAGPASALPGGVITTLYANISPDPGGSYSVCFENPDNESLTIYQYLGGAWVAVATSTSNPICASSSGDGSFYLGS